MITYWIIVKSVPEGIVVNELCHLCRKELLEEIDEILESEERLIFEVGMD